MSRDAVATGRRLAIGIRIDSPSVPRWVATLIERIDAHPDLEAHVLLIPADRARPTRGVFRAYEVVDAFLFHDPDDALERVRLELPPRLGGPEAAAPALDVIVDVGGGTTREPTRAARFGCWSVRHTDARGAAGEPWLFGPVREGGIVRTTVEAEVERRRIVLYESYGAADWRSLHRVRNAACWKGLAALLSRLAMLAAEGWPELVARAVDSHEEPARPQAAPSALAVAGHALHVGARIVRNRLRRLAFRDEWFIATRPTRARRGYGSPGGFTAVPSPPTHYFADPFPFVHDHETLLLFESFDHAVGRGSIWVVPLDDRGVPAARPRPVLERDYHLSYPFVFEHRGAVYMIPESAENRTVDLYRALRFPDEWQLECTLLADIRAVDATLFCDRGRLYLFANVAGDGASLDDDLHLFSAEHLRGPWRPHPGNPVVSDVRSARPAGAIFRDGDRLYRPSQDCSRGYGGAIVLNRIEALDERRYEESVVGRIEPGWMPGVIRTHTVNATDRIEALDAGRIVRRLRRPR